VISKQGEVIAAAVTNLDLHDIARAARTYGVRRYYVVTPLADQQTLVRRILAHWLTGAGAHHNPDRGAALEIIRLQDSLAGVLEHIRGRSGRRPLVVATSSRQHPGAAGFGRLRRLLQAENPCLLLFGTAWGLAPEIIQAADMVLAPINGCTEYNHLAVRSAAAIVLDRLVGPANARRGYAND